MKLIVGLGNPGREYKNTRHNVGFEVVDMLAKKHGIHLKIRRNRSLVGRGIISGKNVLLAKPQTYMNLSGHAVSALIRRHKIIPSNIIIICDDVNLPLGRLRLRASGSAGGHNGLISIIQSLGTEEFARLRIGIGSPRHDMINHVLSRFGNLEREQARIMTRRAADAIEATLASGLEAAMNQYNAPQ